jgi:hypothetical protein
MSATEELCRAYPSLDPATVYAVVEDLNTTTTGNFNLEQVHGVLRAMVPTSISSASAWLDAARHLIKPPSFPASQTSQTDTEIALRASGATPQERLQHTSDFACDVLRRSDRRCSVCKDLTIFRKSVQADPNRSGLAHAGHAEDDVQGLLRTFPDIDPALLRDVWYNCRDRREAIAWLSSIANDAAAPVCQVPQLPWGAPGAYNESPASSVWSVANSGETTRHN